MFEKISKKECVILLQGVIGTVLLYFVFPQIWWKLAIFNYCFAFVYETSMEPLFDYHKDLITQRCISKTDINFLFPLGWNLIFACTATVANFLGGNLPFYILSALFIGGTMEIVFHNLHYWKYNFDAKYLGIYKPFIPKVLIFGVPIQVLLGYSLVGLLVWFFTKYMF